MGAAVVLLAIGFGALAIGILVGRYYVPDDRMLRRTARHARSYMRALNHVLARDDEQAVTELTRVVSENVDEVEPYFALGALFRARGEWERAIRVHQALALRESGSRRLRLRARYELGLDFRTAGMPRRATRAMEECLTEEPKHEGAIRALCGLYEQQARYLEAAAAWRRLRKIEGPPSHRREHHLLVAAAQHALATGDPDSARRLLKDAEKQGGSTPHHLAVAAELAAARGRPEDAIGYLRDALLAAPGLARFLVPGLVLAQRQLVEAKFPADAREVAPERLEVEKQRRAAEQTAAVLDAVLDGAGPEGHLLLAQAEVLAVCDQPRALEMFARASTAFPELLPARLASARLALASNDAAWVRRELEALTADDGALDWALDGAWACTHCGHRAESLFWRCARCRRWATVQLDGGRATPVPPPSPRELPRAPSLLLLGDGGVSEPRDASLTGDELDAIARPSSVVGRAGSWFSGAWATMRGGKSADPFKPPRD